MGELGAQTITTESAIIKIDKQRIVHLSLQEGSYIDLNESKKIVAARKKLALNTKQLFIVDLTNDPVPSKESKEYPNSDDVIVATKAMALITKGKISRIVGNFFIQISKNSCPTKLFANKKDATDWLLIQ